MRTGDYVNTLLVVLATLLLGGAADAAPTKEPEACTVTTVEYLGNTVARTQGGMGYLGATAMCQDEFGPSARFCSSLEIVESLNAPLLNVADAAWVRPSHISQADQYDITGAQSGSGAKTTCQSWTSGSLSGSIYGLAVYGTGVFVPRVCTEENAVACCGLVSR